jgi:RHS repeat-associated protein
MSQVSSGAAGVVVDGAGYLGNGTTSVPWALVNTTASSGLGPKAYLNYIMFDRDFNPIITDATQTNFVRMTDAARETGADVPHERLFAEVAVKQAGYLYIYLSNEESTPLEVFFDDFKVTHTHSPVVQADEYYPFGLTFNGYQREGALDQNFLYNGKELQDELNLAWLDYGARMYMPELGRWSVVDPLAEKATDWTPFRYAFNNPIKMIDPNGMFEYSNGYSSSDSRFETGSTEHRGVFKGNENDLASGSSASRTVVAHGESGRSVQVGPDGSAASLPNGHSQTIPPWTGPVQLKTATFFDIMRAIQYAHILQSQATADKPLNLNLYDLFDPEGAELSINQSLGYVYDRKFTEHNVRVTIVLPKFRKDARIDSSMPFYPGESGRQKGFDIDYRGVNKQYHSPYGIAVFAMGGKGNIRLVTAQFSNVDQFLHVREFVFVNEPRMRLPRKIQPK